MNRIVFILFLVFVLASFLQAQTHVERTIETSDGDETWAIQSTNADTSRTYKTNVVMTLFHWAADTSGDDSVSIKISYDVYHATIGWVNDIRTVTVTADSTNDELMLTDVAIASSKYCRFRATGQAANKKLSSTLLKIGLNGVK